MSNSRSWLICEAAWLWSLRECTMEQEFPEGKEHYLNERIITTVQLKVSLPSQALFHLPEGRSPHMVLDPNYWINLKISNSYSSAFPPRGTCQSLLYYLPSHQRHILASFREKAETLGIDIIHIFREILEIQFQSCPPEGIDFWPGFLIPTSHVQPLSKVTHLE